jgi:hypothetical protein
MLMPVVAGERLFTVRAPFELKGTLIVGTGPGPLNPCASLDAAHRHLHKRHSRGPLAVGMGSGGPVDAVMGLCRADRKSGLIHFRCKLKSRSVSKPLLVLMKPAAAGQLHDSAATAKPGSLIEQQFQQFEQLRTRYLAPRVNKTRIRVSATPGRRPPAAETVRLYAGEWRLS